jgi:hypothetical protein
MPGFRLEPTFSTNGPFAMIAINEPLYSQFSDKGDDRVEAFSHAASASGGDRRGGRGENNGIQAYHESATHASHTSVDEREDQAADLNASDAHESLVHYHRAILALATAPGGLSRPRRRRILQRLLLCRNRLLNEGMPGPDDGHPSDASSSDP